MAIWNEIQEQLKELDERKQLDEMYNKIKADNDRITI